MVNAKLDRLARNVEFRARLMNSGVEFVAVDFSQAKRSRAQNEDSEDARWHISTCVAD